MTGGERGANAADGLRPAVGHRARHRLAWCEGRVMPIGNSNAGGGPIGLFGLEGRADRYAPRLDIGSGFRVPIGLSA
jgi:hypothetical protein